MAHHEKYCEDTREVNLNATNDTHWGIVGQCNGGGAADGGTPYDRSRQYHWLMTKHALVEKGMIEDTRGNADCACGKVETQWHVLLSCKENGQPVRKRYRKVLATGSLKARQAVTGEQVSHNVSHT